MKLDETELQYLTELAARFNRLMQNQRPDNPAWKNMVRMTIKTIGCYDIVLQKEEWKREHS